MALPRPSRSTPPTEPEGSDAPDPVVLALHSPSDIILAAPPERFARNTIWLVATLVFAMLALAAFVPMDREVVADGRVISRAPTIQIEPLTASIVRTIDAHVGEIVHTGQVLATLDPTNAEANLKALLARRAALAARVAEERAEFDGRPYEPPEPVARDQMLQAAIYAQRMAELRYTLSGYDQQARGLAAKLSAAAAEAAYYRDQLALASEIERMNRMLERLNAGSRLTVLRSEQERIAAASHVARSIQAKRSAAQTLAATRAERDAFLQKWKAKLSSRLAADLTELASVQESIVKAKLVSRLVTLRAPEDAVIFHVHGGVSPGSVLRSGERLVTLSALHAPLEIESYVKGSDQGFVQPGQSATIKFATLPFVLFGTAQGTVRLLTADSFTPAQVMSQLAALPTAPQSGSRDIPTSELYYAARVAIDVLHLRGVPANFRLRPGMPVETDIRVGSETLLEYLLVRVAPVFYQGMREPG